MVMKSSRHLSQVNIYTYILESILVLLCSHERKKQFPLIHKLLSLLSHLPFSSFPVLWVDSGKHTSGFLFFASLEIHYYFLHLHGQPFTPNNDRQLHLDLNGKSQLSVSQLSYIWVLSCTNQFWKDTQPPRKALRATNAILDSCNLL